uniref:Mantle protein N25 n=1 Tax=Pinctada fucata TaxID=50426 RepID=A0A0E3XA28_PINFU|nr:mantle protein N25 [Pinctada fucata]
MKRIYVLVLLFILLVCIAEAQKKSKDSKKASSKSSSKSSGKSKSSPKSSGAKGKSPAPSAPASKGPSEMQKLAEEMVALSNRLLKAIKAGEQMPPPMCPNGLPKADCSPLACDKWTCSNILNTVCKEQCHVCEPKFYIGGSEVTQFCELKPANMQPRATQSPPTSRNTATDQGPQNSGPSSNGAPSNMPPMPGMPMMFSENPMPMGGPPGMEFMPNFENFPPGMSPMQFFHHLQNMNMPNENQGSRSQAN